MIPQAAPMWRIARYASDVRAAIAEVLNGDSLVGGPQVSAFEAEFALSTGAAHCVGVNSGTDALALALRALGVGPGDEVITVALTAAGTAHAILHAGAEPRFVDVDDDTWVMDPIAAEAAITPRTKAILAVHLYGRPAPAEDLRAIADRRGLFLVEDCAQAHGATLNNRPVGSFGHVGAFSFYPTKNLGALGDGGAVVTDDLALAERVRALRSYGWPTKSRISMTIGYNSRLDELQAAVLLALLPHLGTGNSERRAAAAQYRSRLGGARLQLPLDDRGAVYHQFAIRVADRDTVAARLETKYGVRTAVHYTPALHHQPAFADFPHGPLPVTERLCDQLLSLPIQPEITARHLETIADAVIMATNE